jgi:hypothetical protein
LQAVFVVKSAEDIVAFHVVAHVYQRRKRIECGHVVIEKSVIFKKPVVFDLLQGCGDSRTTYH